MKRAREPRNDVVLCLQEFGTTHIELIRPQCLRALRIDQPRIDAHRAVAAQHAALKRITDAEVRAQLLDVDGLALEGEGTAGGNDSRAAQLRQSRCQFAR